MRKKREEQSGGETEAYETPAWCVDRLVDEVWLPAGTYLEPCAGSGNIIRAVTKRVGSILFDAIEIRPECETPLKTANADRTYSSVIIGDFFEHAPKLFAPDPTKPNTAWLYDGIITNPPNSLAFEVAEACKKIAPFVAMLLPLNFLSSAKRHPVHRVHMPSEFRLLPDRVQFNGEGSIALEYGWAIWTPDRSAICRTCVLATTPIEERRGAKGALVAEQPIDPAAQLNLIATQPEIPATPTPDERGPKPPITDDDLKDARAIVDEMRRAHDIEMRVERRTLLGLKLNNAHARLTDLEARYAEQRRTAHVPITDPEPTIACSCPDAPCSLHHTDAGKAQLNEAPTSPKEAPPEPKAPKADPVPAAPGLPPFLVTDSTAKKPCQPGAWGSPTSCLMHEGQPLGEDGRCFWGRARSDFETQVHAAFEEEAIPHVVGEQALAIGPERWAHERDRCAAAASVLAWAFAEATADYADAPTLSNAQRADRARKDLVWARAWRSHMANLASMPRDREVTPMTNVS